MSHACQGGHTDGSKSGWRQRRFVVVVVVICNCSCNVIVVAVVVVVR